MADRIDQITLGSSSYDIDLPVDNRIQKYTAHYLTTTGTAANTTSGSYYHAKWDAAWDETPYAWSVIDNDSTMGDAAKIEAYDALLYDGLCIHIRVPIAGNGTYGTGLKIGNGKYHPVVYNVNSMVSTRYSVNSTIELIYNSNTTGTLYIDNASTTVSGVWQAMDYDSNTTTTYGTIDYYFRPYVGENRLTRYKLVAQDKDNRIIPITTEQYLGDYSSSTTYAKDEVVTVSGVFYKSLQASNKKHAPASSATWWTTITPFTPNITPFRPDKIWLFNTTSTYNASSVIGGQVLTSVGYSNYGGNYNFYGGIDGTSAGIPAYRMVYLCGTYDKATGLFTLDTTNNTSYYTLVPDNTTSITLSSYFTSGKDYILVGSTYSSNNYLQLFMVNTLFHFDGTNLVPYDKMSLTASDIDDLGFVRNGNGQSIAESQVTNLVSDLSALAADISSVREVAAGKTNTYVVSDASVSGYSNASLNSQDATVEITSKLKSVGNTDINLADLKVGDNIYVTEVNVPDRWVSSITKSGSTVTKIALSKLETAKCHVQDVTYNGSSIVGNDGVAVVPVYTDHNQTVKSGSTTFGADATINITADNTNFVTVTPSSNTITIGSPLTTQTAYTWSSDGLTIPNITTNTKGQVTAIYDQSIDFSGCAKVANDFTTIDLGSSSSGTLTTAQLSLAKSKKAQVVFKWGNYFFYGENFTSSSTYYWSCPVWYSGSSIVKRVITLTTSSGAWSESEYTYSPESPIETITSNTTYVEGNYYRKSTDTYLQPFMVGNTILQNDKIYFDTTKSDELSDILSNLSYSNNLSKLLATDDDSYGIFAVNVNGYRLLAIADGTSNSIGGTIVFSNRAGTVSSLGLTVTAGWQNLSSDNSYTWIRSTTSTITAINSNGWNGIIIGSDLRELKGLVKYEVGALPVDLATDGIYVDTSKEKELISFLEGLTYGGDMPGMGMAQLLEFGGDMGMYALKVTSEDEPIYVILLVAEGFKYIYASDACTVFSGTEYQSTIPKGFQNLNANNCCLYIDNSTETGSFSVRAICYPDWNGKFFGSGIVNKEGSIYRYEGGKLKKILVEGDAAASSGGAIEAPVEDVQINGTSILNSKVANIVTNTAYNASSNKIATMSDLPSTITSVNGLSGGTISSGTTISGDMIANYVKITSIGHETVSNYDKHLTLSSSNYIRYRTTSELKSDLGVPTMSASGNRSSGYGVSASAAGQIDSDKYRITSSGTAKATIQYDSDSESIQFIF